MPRTHCSRLLDNITVQNAVRCSREHLLLPPSPHYSLMSAAFSFSLEQDWAPIQRELGRSNRTRSVRHGPHCPPCPTLWSCLQPGRRHAPCPQGLRQRVGLFRVAPPPSNVVAPADWWYSTICVGSAGTALLRLRVNRLSRARYWRHRLGITLFCTSVPRVYIFVVRHVLL